MRVVALDGPAGSGKSTTARAVAAALGLPVLDTGAMYRAVAFAALRAGVPLDDGAALARLAEASEVEVDTNVRLDGEDVTAAIRGPEVTAHVSQVAAHPAVRACLVRRQREWVEAHGGGVVEGRDIGTVVFPQAPVKVYLTASDEVRAARRARDEASADRPAEVAEVRSALARRDATDAGRTTSPLAVAADAIVVDTTDRSVASIAEEIVAHFRAAEARA